MKVGVDMEALSILTVCMLLAAPAFAQSDRGTITGTVTDQDGGIVPGASVVALNAGMRDGEIRGLQWGRLDLSTAILTVGESKTEAGEGRRLAPPPFMAGGPAGSRDS